MLRLFILILIFFNTSCNGDKPIVITLSNYKKYSLKEEHTSVILLNSFVTNNKCHSSANIFYANIFMCKTTFGSDTILVFSLCKKPYDFLKNDYKGERDLIIDSAKVVSNIPNQVLSRIDDTVLKKGYSYIFTDLIKLEY
jgi:hypothetical protein